jgi:peptidylprolyl isomerase
MTKAKYGDRVRVHYKGCRQDGSIVASTEGNSPVEVKLGSGRLVPGLEESIIGMVAGETKTVVVPPERAYGPWMPELIVNLSANDFPDDIVPVVGKQVLARQNDGSLIHATIRRVTGTIVTLDANHPLAGETLTFSVQVVELA